MERESFVFYRSFLEGIESLPTAKERYEALRAILNFGLNGIDEIKTCYLIQRNAA